LSRTLLSAPGDIFVMRSLPFFLGEEFVIKRKQQTRIRFQSSGKKAMIILLFIFIFLVFKCSTLKVSKGIDT
jgi:hypothetical protein